MKLIINGLLITSAILFNSCANLNQNAPPQESSYMEIMNTYSGEYYVGVGTGEGYTEESAVKIAKARALGELADNVKVTILSRLEIASVEMESGSSYQFDETVKEQIISIGNATVRSPEYEILNVSHGNDKYYAEVVAKKLKSQHIEETTKDLDYLNDVDELLKLLK